ncbi:arylsulfatase [Candidimonas nitroreducens]|uniref:Arylsulfatase n=1 Tax=Candidimonas nitroreducens TaxID=683354 RepID=A0A225M673_9BURK|nr:arylsulfatase [Candidimonas nitroreducens]OWT56844.1 arylsulfatase [Candidimonas nitroreducens]
MKNRDELPPKDPEFEGKIGKTYADSVPDFPKPVQPPAGAPNVVLVLLDDVGFGHPSTFGGPVSMPTLDRLARRGLKYNRFHTTAMCTPTRAAVLTGRNHHNVASGSIANLATGFPGYNGIWPRDSACVAQILRSNGYSTGAFGKWHNTPEWETSPVGPFDRWPTGMGFEYFYGFLGADCNQWDPPIIENTRPVIRRETKKKDLHLDEDLADHAIDWIRMHRAVDPSRPFFLYFAPGTAHSPHHAPKEWIDKYRGCFDHGWDSQREQTFARQRELGIIPAHAELTPRPPEIPAWSEATDDEKKLGARLMEAFAGALSHCDHQIGRVMEELAAQGIDDDTLVIFIAGDNGPSAEGTLQGQINKWGNLNGAPQTLAQMLERIDDIGGPMSYTNYPVGWAWAGSAPMQWVKQIASHFGGTRNGVVVSWPRKIADRGTLREQFHHCIDIVPTILEATGIPAPASVNGIEQAGIEGVSMMYSFDKSDAPSTRRTQYFELFGHRAIYHEGWVAGVRHRGRLPWQIAGGGSTGDFDSDPWELYHVDIDFSQARDLAATHPEKLRELQLLWWEQAQRGKVLPLDDRYGERYHQGPSPSEGRTHFVYQSGVFGIPEGSAPNLKGRSHRITADLTIPVEGPEGMLVTAGGRFGGYGMYVRKGHLHYVHNLSGEERYTVVSTVPVPAGRTEITMTFTVDQKKLGSGGHVQFTFNGVEAGGGYVPRTVPIQYSYTETFDVGLDTGTPIDETYSCPFPFTGQIHRLTVDVLDDLSAADRAEEERLVSQARHDNE